jgi:hypothetical protein
VERTDDLTIWISEVIASLRAIFYYKNNPMFRAFKE